MGTVITATKKRRLSGTICVLLLVCGLAVAATARDDSSAQKSTSSEKSTTSHKTTSKSKNSSKKHRKKSTKVRGQQKIDSQRTQEIQEALIREHYLNGEATGKWSQATEDALRRYQADNGWQSKTVPDSRALIKLGLGPSKDHLLNPDTAMTTIPDPPKSASATPTSNSAQPVANPPLPAGAQTAPASSTGSGPQ